MEKTVKTSPPEQLRIPESAPRPAPPADPFLEGFAEGRRSMARSIALKLSGQMPDADLASLLGLSEAELGTLVGAPTPRPERPAAEDGPDAPARARLLSGLTFVEPFFIRTVRAARGLTQPELASRLGVHPRTVCEWETSSGPVRIHTATYRKLSALAAPHAR